MQAIRIRTRIESQQLNLPQLAPLVGRDVEIIVLAPSDATVPVVNPEARQPRQPGSGKGTVWMAPDFDEPLDDFADYM